MAKNVKARTVENVMYVKLNSYYASFLKIRYGVPLMFPKMSALNQCVESFLVNNPTSIWSTFFCCTQIMFEGNDNLITDCRNDDIQDPDKRLLFVPVSLPQELVRFGRTFVTGPTWQLSNRGTEVFRKLVKHDFWISFSAFWEDCRFRAERLGEKASIEDVISDFAIQYDISMKEYENLLRYWRRIRNTISEDIEARRKWLEQNTGRFFEYTV